MASIFLSYTTRDADGSGRRWSQQIAAWLREWGYEDLYLDKDPATGTPAASEWRRVLHSRLRQCRAVIALCTPEYQASPWCMVEVGIALDRGRLVFPIHLGEEHLPGPLQHRQAIALDEAIALDPANAADARQRLKQALDENISWQEKLRWEPLGDSRSGRRPFHRCPFPGLKAYDASHAPVFFGRDDQIKDLEALVRRKCNAGSGLLLLLGSSGCGKSSLLGAGLVPLLRQGERTGAPWLLLEPFRPLRDPFAQLNARLTAAGVEPLPAMASDQDPNANVPSATDLLQRLDQLRLARPEATVLLVIDQFEELLTDKADGFLKLLAELLQLDDNRVLLLASLRTDALARLEQHPSGLTRLRDATNDQVLLQPIAREAFEELITKPLERLDRGIEPTLLQALLKECASGGGDLLPLLSFTLQQLWEKQEDRWVKAEEQPPPWRDLLLADYIAMEKLKGSVDKAATDSGWRRKANDEEGLLAVRQAFLRHLVRLTEGDEPSRRQARRSELPPRSLAALDCLVNARLLVSGSVNVSEKDAEKYTETATEKDTGKVAEIATPKRTEEPTLEIAHEALLRTWPTLATWIEEGREELLQCRRVKRLTDDLAATGAEKRPLRRNALEQLAALAAQDPGTGEHLAVRQEGTEPLAKLLASQAADEADRLDAALILALIGAEQPLQACLADGAAPVGVRRRAAESLGLLAKRSGDPEQRERIERQLEAVLRGERLDVRIEPVDDPAALAMARQVAQQEVAAQVAAARASGQLAGVPEAQLLQMIQQAEEEAEIRQPWASGKAPGWKEHDERLPLLQGASRGLQLAASAALPMLGSGPGRLLPMLTLTALEEGGGLHITTEVVEREVWQLPLPGGEQLELVMVPGGTYTIGSPREEMGRDVYTQAFMKCEGVNVEARREVRLAAFALVRQPISQAQWRAVVEAATDQDRGQLRGRPAAFKEPANAWERHGEPEALPVNQVSWNDCRRWLACLNGLWQREWARLGRQGVAPQLALPSESQWEAACRGGADTPFHFGATLDAHWARYDAGYCYGKGRRGAYEERPAPIGFSGLVNHWGLADLHGQVAEWCADQWQRDPVARLQGDGGAAEGPDPELADVPLERDSRLLRGGSWYLNLRLCRSAFRNHREPGFADNYVGFRVVCLPQGPSLNP